VYRGYSKRQEIASRFGRKRQENTQKAKLAQKSKEIQIKQENIKQDELQLAELRQAKELDRKGKMLKKQLVDLSKDEDVMPPLEDPYGRYGGPLRMARDYK
jgi:hypothetical protein